MEISRCKPAGKPEGWYDATGTRYYHPQELMSRDWTLQLNVAVEEIKGLFPSADRQALFCLGELLLKPHGVNLRGIMQNDILSALDDCVELGMTAEQVREVIRAIVVKALLKTKPLRQAS